MLRTEPSLLQGQQMLLMTEPTLQTQADSFRVIQFHERSKCGTHQAMYFLQSEHVTSRSFGKHAFTTLPNSKI